MGAFGLCGAHRTGKTTLAQHFADRHGLPFVRTSTSRVFAEQGLDPAQVLNFEQRLWIQEKVLSAAEQDWRKATRFVTDRTPIDFMAYTLADIQGHTDVDHAALEHYMTRCFAACAGFFAHLVVVQPGIPLVAEAGKAALTPAYIAHLHSLVLGLCHDSRQTCRVSVLPRSVLDLETRLNSLARLILC